MEWCSTLRRAKVGDVTIPTPEGAVGREGNLLGPKDGTVERGLPSMSSVFFQLSSSLLTMPLFTKPNRKAARKDAFDVVQVAGLPQP